MTQLMILREFSDIGGLIFKSAANLAAPIEISSGCPTILKMRPTVYVSKDGFRSITFENLAQD